MTDTQTLDKTIHSSECIKVRNSSGIGPPNCHLSWSLSKELDMLPADYLPCHTESTEGISGLYPPNCAKPGPSPFLCGTTLPPHEMRSLRGIHFPVFLSSRK